MSISIKQYIDELSDLLCCEKALKNQFLFRFQKSLEEFEQECDDPLISYSDLVSEFGTPQETADDFLSQIDSDQIQPLLKTDARKKKLFAAFCITAVLVLAGLSFYRVYLNKLARDGYFDPDVYYLSPEEAQTFDPNEIRGR